MKRILTVRVAVSLFGLLLSTSILCAPTANAQIPIGIPKPLYRFVTPNSSLSRTFLTTDYQEGINRGYIFWDTVGGVIVPPAPGWTPVPGQGLAPMYRWRVAHRSGTNYYYSGGLWPNLLSNPENTLEGITAYALVPAATAGSSGLVLHLWYSQDNGYFYSVNGSMTIPAPPPPGPGSYTWQGVAYRMVFGFTGPIPSPCIPATGCFLFNPPAAAPTCDATQVQTCNNNGGTWNSANCTCSYPPPPNPCREFNQTNKKESSGEEDTQQLIPLPCRQSLPF